jgi:hypothetical protein
MKNSTYTLNQHCVTYILLVSFFLQSCGNFSNTPVTGEFIAKESTDNIQEPTKPIDIKSLVDQELNAEGGYLVTFHEEKGNLVADIRVDKTQKEPNYRNLPVEIEKGTDLAALPHLNKRIQQRHIQLERVQNKQPRLILIFKGGLAGGMKKGSYGSDEEDEEGNVLEDPDEIVYNIPTSNQFDALNIVQVGINSSKMRFARLLQRVTDTTRNILTVKYNINGEVVYLVLFSMGLGHTKLELVDRANERKRGHTEGIFYAIMRDQKIKIPNGHGSYKELALLNENIEYISSTNEPCSGKRSENCKEEIINRILEEQKELDEDKDIKIYYNNKYEVGGTEKTGNGFRSATNKFFGFSIETSEKESEKQGTCYVLDEIPDKYKHRGSSNKLFKATPLDEFLKKKKRHVDTANARPIEKSASQFRKKYKKKEYINKGIVHKYTNKEQKENYIEEYGNNSKDSVENYYIEDEENSEEEAIKSISSEEDSGESSEEKKKPNKKIKKKSTDKNSKTSSMDEEKKKRPSSKTVKNKKKNPSKSVNQDKKGKNK